VRLRTGCDPAGDRSAVTADVSLLARLLWHRGMRGRERRVRERLEAHRARALADRRAHAVARSPSYRRRHAGLERAPLSDLPIVTKADLMERCEEVATDRRVRRAAVEAFLATARPGGRHPDRRRPA
jgi:hypothetical protein